MASNITVIHVEFLRKPRVAGEVSDVDVSSDYATKRIIECEALDACGEVNARVAVASYLNRLADNP